MRVFEIPSLIAGRAGSYHASGSGPAHQRPAHGAWAGHHFKTGRFLLRDAGSSLKEKPISRRIPRLRSSRGLRAFPGREMRQRSRGRCVASRLLPCARASRAAAKMCDPSAYSLRLASLRTLVRTEQAERLRTAIDALTSCQVISCRPTRGAMVKRGAPIAWPRVFENSNPQQLAAADHRGGGGGKTQAHSDGEALRARSAPQESLSKGQPTMPARAGSTMRARGAPTTAAAPRS